MSRDNNGNGKNGRLWALALPVLSMVFGAGGAMMVTRADVARHEKCIESLTVKSVDNEKAVARIDERLSHMERDLAEINASLKELRW